LFVGIFETADFTRGRLSSYVVWLC